MKKLWRRALPLLLCLVTLVTLFPVQPVQAAEETAMKTSDAYIKLLKGWEGFRSTPYWDVSHYSIGYGTTCPDDKVDYYTKNPMSEATAEQWLQSSLTGFENSVNSYAKKHGLKLKQQQFDALVSFTYNCGASWMSELNGYFNTAVRYGDTGRLFMYGIGLYGSAGGEYILMRRRMREANIYLNGQYTNEYPDNYRWVFLNGGGAQPRYPVYAFDANKPEAIQVRFSSIPVGKTADGTSFIYELAGWYTEDGKQVTKLDTSLVRGQILYARWKDPDGKVVKLPTGTPVASQKLTVVKDSANIRKGPGTYYDKTGTLSKGATVTLKEVYVVGSTTWGNTDKGWMSLANTDYVTPAETFPRTGKVNASGVNYRKGPGTSYSSYGKMSKNEKLTIIAVNDKNTWGKFIKDGKECWISLDYVTYDAKTVSKLELLKLPDKLNYANYKRPLELEGSVIRITYADGTQVVRSIAMSDVDDDRTSTSTSATVTATVGGKSVTFKVYFGKYTELKITKQPEDVIVELGENASTSVDAEGEGLTYQWYVKNPDSTTYVTSSVQSKVYSYEMTEEKSGRKIYCVVSDKYGNSIKSDVVTLKTPEFAEILKQPTDVKVKVGKVGTVEVEAKGDGRTYQWYYQDPGEEAAKSSVTTATYSFTMTEEKNGRKIFCEVADQYGNKVTSDAATLILAQDIVITQQPVSVTVAEDEILTVNVGATGEGLTYKWYYKEAGGSAFYYTSTFTGPEYSVAMTDARNGRQIYCVVGDEYGDSVKTDTVTLSMKETAKITQQPVSVKVLEGKEARASVVATGDGITYQWYVKVPGAEEFSQSAVTIADYFFTMTADKSGRQVYCVVTDQYGNTAQTETVTLEMAEAPKITKQPESVIVAAGEDFTISFTAEGDGLTYKWYYKEKGGSSFFLTNTFTDNTYSTTMSDARNGRQVYCVVTDQYGNTVKTDTVTMSMEEGSSQVTITKQPTSVTVANGKTARVYVTASGEGLTYQWYVKDAGESSFKTSSVKDYDYYYTMTAAKSGRQVYCEVTDQYGNTVKTDTVTMSMEEGSSQVTITKQPTSVTVANGKTARVYVTASGEGLTYQWYVKDAGESSFKTSSVKDYDYYYTMTAAKSGRQVYCEVTDQYGNTVKTDTVTMSMEAAASKVKITKQPESVTVAKGEEFTISFTAEGEDLTYKWYYKEKGGSTFYLTDTFKSNTYTTTMSDARNGRQVYCVVKDKYGNKVQTNTVTMTMEGSSSALTITRQPVSAAAVKGETVTVTFDASGEGLTYTWYYKDAGKSIFSKSGLGKGNTYSVEMTAARNGRKLYCVVKDKHGNKVQTNTVTITMSALKITDQPDNVTVANGKTASTKVVASGEGLKYQWYVKNPGTTSFVKSSLTTATYSYTMVAEKSGRQVYCIITDKYGATVKTNTVTMKAK